MRLRFFLFVLVSIFAVTIILSSSASSRRIASTAVDTVHLPDIIQAKLPSVDDLHLVVPWYHVTHKPPVQKNSTSGDAAWYTDWRWLNPFSSSVTLDEQRAVLPPPFPRTPVYTYYDTTLKRDKDLKEADAQLLLTWRRAWWAQGFRPIVLTQAEALSNPLYSQLQSQNVSAKLEFEVARWLAWEHMGRGILASYTCYPMAGYEDPLLVHLRHNEFEKLTRFHGLESAIFAGNKGHITRAVRELLDKPKLADHDEILHALDQRHFRVEQAVSIASYRPATISAKYVKLHKIMDEDLAKGTHLLNQLVNSHLHDTWQDSYREGIAVLRPLPAHTTKLIEPGGYLARLLAECPDSILPTSCPPNAPKCTPCVVSKLTVKYAESFRNLSTQFVVAVIPHPLTLISLESQNMDVDTAYIRRKTERDPWIRSSTRSVLGDGRGGPSRVVALKDMIASQHSRSRGLWFTVEHFPPGIAAPPNKPKAPVNDPQPPKTNHIKFPENWLEDLDWHFGFPVPRSLRADGESYSPIPGTAKMVKGIESIKSSYDPPPPTYEQELLEINILETARNSINNKDKAIRAMRQVAEAWNLADSEIWKFARAFRARSILERQQWQNEEAAYDAPGLARGSRWW